ncbi:MAG: DUF1232 domain-containing protein [Anaerolineae bacterium]|nr:DUF1232 domain-containing protein [Anaerolineae bacterium]
MTKHELKSKEAADQLGFFLTPLSLRGIPVWLTYLAGLVGLLYVLNPTAGVIEAIPDNLPFIGNLDEGVAFTLLWYSLVELFEGHKYR